MGLNEQLVVFENAILKLVDRDYAYLDLPGHFNIGDHLIYNGAMTVFKKSSHKCVYQSVVENVIERRISEDVIIVLHGGGNWGDGFYTPFRARIVANFPKNKIVVMPQTIRYPDEDSIERDAALYAEHDDLHLCARDRRSYEILKKYFSANHIYLLPDSAVGLYGVLPKWELRGQEKSLFIKRMDDELALEPWDVPNADVRDWDTILDELSFSKLLYPYMGIRKVKKVTGTDAMKNVANKYMASVMESFFMKKIPSYFQRYNKLYTTRLHGLLLAKLMDMPVEYQDTKYGKISGYCETWF